MKIKNFLALSLLIVFMAFIGGCHYGLVDRYRDYSGYDSYRDGLRDGHSYERYRDRQSYSRDRYNYRNDRW